MSVDPVLLQRFIEDSGLQFKKNAVSYIFTCPRCEKDKKLFIRQRDGMFRCWYCAEINGFKGKGEYALAELTQLPLDVVKQKLGLSDDFEVPSVDHVTTRVLWPYAEEEADEDDFGNGLLPMQWPVDYYPIEDPRSQRGLEYLQARGIPLDIAQVYGLRYSPKERRVVFPAQYQGQLYGWQGRTILPHKWWDEKQECMREVPKILSSRAPDNNGWRERCLMFWDRLDGSDHAILCEGPVDAIKAHLCGGNVCAMGKSVSRSQLLLLRSSGIRKLYLALDPDAAAETSRLIQDIGADLEVYLIEPPRETDLGAMTFEEVYDLYTRARRPEPGEILYYLRHFNDL